MLDTKVLLNILYYNGSYTSYKTKLGQCGRDTMNITLSDTDEILIGYHKPIKYLYFDLTTPNTNSSSISVEYYNGSTWVELDIIDDTNDLERSGFIQWEELDGSLQKESTINLVTNYWIKIKTDTTHTASVWNFIGLIFCTNQDLLLENPYILDTNLLMGEIDHLKHIIASRNEIVQSYSNKGYEKYNASLEAQRITLWDMLDIEEFKQGAIFLALSKIYFNLSDKDEDTWLKKSESYRQRYLDQIDLYYSTLDTNDNGITGNSERMAVANTKTISR